MRVSVVIPTFNEAGNIETLLRRLFHALEMAAMRGEAIVVDDRSPDGTADVAEETLGGRGRVLRRQGPRGLAFAVEDGFAEARSEVICVMDADLSHPPESVPALVKAVEDGADLAVGSRYVAGGGIAGWPRTRRLLSRAACLMARPLTPIRDSTSGFFCLRRPVIEGLDLHTGGFKIGLELFVRGNIKRVREIPFTFTDRQAGRSKLGRSVMLQYLLQLARLSAHRFGRRG